ncbi:diaminopimelate epimerase [Fulvivirga kasyanovii]|uniref:Diaminopimelate epimerase n=1 Tax=Fulvivirga kasyanovii TaxID=396812 RepID=A0ABW9RW22_9BACT|nr:diaminopimelate epimerase [Fulvivirga kasyanovii]MTI28439.1 diaminopimelate epimerase [Fulvivirga kasyanovii]
MDNIKFYKYQATGNDFILIDNRTTGYKFSSGQIQKLCDRKFGIGADGLILIQDHDSYDFEMVYYNPDGSQSLCGNGSRCAVNFASHLGIVGKSTRFLAYDGEHLAEILDNEEVRLKMADVQNVRLMADGMFIDTGSPHLIKYVINVKNYRVYDEGKAIRNGGLFKEAGVNVNFVEITGNSEIFNRTYERGVENETLSCGTGVTAAAISASHKGLESPVTVNTIGGTLAVEFKKHEDGSYSDVYLIGPAERVFEGTIEMPA